MNKMTWLKTIGMCIIVTLSPWQMASDKTTPTASGIGAGFPLRAEREASTEESETQLPAACRLELPESMSDIHNVFHISQLRKCLQAPESHIEEEAVQIQKDLQYREKLVKILDSAVRKTHTLEVKLYKVQWSREGEEEATWESEDSLRREYLKVA
jgi:hypothetical protein